MNPVNIRAQARRQWLSLLVTGVALMSGVVGHRSAMAASEHARARANLLRLANPTHAAPVGHALLPQLAHPTAAALVLALTTRLSLVCGVEITGLCSIETLQQAFQKAVLADFAEARCYSVSGWVLTRTEAELCALAAMAAMTGSTGSTASADRA